MQRRQLILASGAIMAGFAVASCSSSTSGPHTKIVTDRWFMPDESEKHKRTWMAFGASKKNWGSKLLPHVQRELATIARTIADYEPVTMLVRSDEIPLARSLVGEKIELIPTELDDIWIRDSGPVFVHRQHAKAAIKFNFNGWGQKQSYTHDAKVADSVARNAGVQLIGSSLVLEGGAIEVDGDGTAIITESCVLNPNRNPGRSRADVETELSNLLGLQKIIWLPGIAGKDITDGHTDFYARFTSPGVVVAALDTDPTSFDYEVTRRHLDILKTATDAKGRKLQVTTLDTPNRIRPGFDGDNFAAGYINFYVCNGAVIIPEFGDNDTDLIAQQALQRLFPNRAIRPIAIDSIAAGGGGIHCVTQQEPAM